MSCAVSAPNGANLNCVKNLSEAQAAIIMDPSVNFETLAALDNIENIRVLLEESRTGFVVEFNGSDPTPAEVVTETTGFGDNIITSENTPSFVGYAKINACDFKEILNAYKGGSYRVAFMLADGSMMATEIGTAFGGFLTQVYASRFGIPGRENQTQQFKINFNFLVGSEFDNYRVIGVNYGIDDLKLLLPLALQADVQTPFDGNAVVLNVYTRCVPGDPKSGVMTAEVTKGTLGLDITATPTDDGNGQYTVVVQKTGPVDLAVGEYAEFVLVTKTGNVYDEISNTIKVVGQ